MIQIENDCVGPCPMGCIDCGRKRVPYFYCDDCGGNVDELYNYGDKQLCKKCLLDMFDKVDIDDY